MQLSQPLQITNMRQSGFTPSDQHFCATAPATPCPRSFAGTRGNQFCCCKKFTPVACAHPLFKPAMQVLLRSTLHFCNVRPPVSSCIKARVFPRLGLSVALIKLTSRPLMSHKPPLV